MGSDPITTVVRAGMALGTGGMSEVLGVGKKVAGKKVKVGSTAAVDVANNKESNIKRRKALYETDGGVLGQEVSGVGAVGRKNLFGN